MNADFFQNQTQAALSGAGQLGEKALEAVADVSVGKSGGWLRNFLHGTWLGHPLHPAAVEVPIGAFTTATVLDIVDAARGERRLAAGADAAVGIGLVTASLAAASGLADWSKIDQPAKRAGVMHATLNGGATLCYLASYVLRKRGQRTAAMETGIAGWLLLMAGSYLGARLVYNHKVGVDHAQREDVPAFTPVLPISELPEHEPHRVEVNGVGILLYRRNGELFAIGETCAHLGGPLSEGRFDGATVQCPWHGSKFDLRTGQVIEGPSAFSQPCFETRVARGQIEVRVNHTPAK